MTPELEKKLREIVQHLIIDEGYGYSQRIDMLERKIEMQNKVIKILAGKIKEK